MLKITPVIILLLRSLTAAYGQGSLDSLSQPAASVDRIIPLKNQVVDSKIKTAILFRKESPTGFPILSIHTTNQLTLSFDDLKNEFTEYRFNFVHCDKNWLPYPNPESDFFESQQSRYLENSEFSSATRVEFIRYTLQFPRQDERFLKSGNYLIQIIDVEKDTLVLMKRFMVSQGGINVNAKTTFTDDVEYRDYRQQIKFEIYDPKDVLADLSMLHVVIAKNNSWDIQCNLLKPSFVTGDKIQFERTDKCYFEGGNEYRSFNIIDARNISNNVVKMDVSNSGFFRAWLDLDRPRSYLKYSSMEDLNGDFLYTGHNKSFKATELDYTEMHFSLKMDEPMLGYDIYVYGGLTDFQMDENFKMVYNPDQEIYELSALLKQGFYNYIYVVKSIYQDEPDESLIEGSHFETENTYQILVYYHAPFEGYDQLIGTTQINSRMKLEQFYKK